MPTGTLTNSTQRQDSHSVSMPPATRPVAAPPTETAVYRPMARVRSAGAGNIVISRASAVGEASAPPTPWMARAVSSSPCPWAKPPASEASVNRAMPARKTRRRPRMSPARAPSSSSPPKVRV